MCTEGFSIRGFSHEVQHDRRTITTQEANQAEIYFIYDLDIPHTFVTVDTQKTHIGPDLKCLKYYYPKKSTRVYTQKENESTQNARSP